jgi:hypothetical protein
MDRFMLLLFDSVFGKVFLGEISEATVRVFRCMIIFPGFIGFIVLLQEDTFELILAWIRYEIHCICEARLSLRSELAMELCCNFGSIV